MIQKDPHTDPAQVLLVDDDANTRLLGRACLEKAGFRVEEAENGEQCLLKFAQIRPDIVLLDVVMPKMDGITACMAIRKFPAGIHVPILMMTGLDDEESINHSYEAGATDFTLKPINWHVLPHRVRYLLRASRAIAELAKALEDLKALDKAKDAFLSSVSHELRTPLTSIRSFSEILYRYEDTDSEERKEFLRIINTESERLTRLIDDVLDIAKIEAGRMVWNDDVLSLKELIVRVSRVHEPLLRNKSLGLLTDIPSDLPPVLADLDRIQQVITNLLSNAIKFSSKGGQIRIWAERLEGKRSGEAPKWIKVALSDQGIGIEQKDFATIFDKFRQVSQDTLTDKPSGTGLGLPICREIISHYGGNIWVESEKGRGSTFFFTLPAAPDNSAARGFQPDGDSRSAPELHTS